MVIDKNYYLITKYYRNSLKCSTKNTKLEEHIVVECFLYIERVTEGRVLSHDEIKRIYLNAFS